MYSNEHTPTKSQSFSFPRTPVSNEMQRTHSLQGLPLSSPIPSRLQIPSPAESSSIPYTEMAAMPSPRNADALETPSIGRHRKHTMSRTSSPQAEREVQSGGLSEVDLDARVRASVRNTGVSNEKIAEYISGPDPKDGKYVCTYDGCNCRFGRKENIKSHVQTHLDDRPYQCDVCDKLFVRGHDLKRHLKTHTGKKPFECLCGASFARHDALTRHRQRDMCVGGVTGFVPKTTRRGRPPKKSRPDIETRQSKSTRTRQRVAEKVSSVSPVKLEYASLQQAPIFNSPNYAPSTAMSSFTPPTSPGHVGTSLISQIDDDLLPPPLSPPQMAHARYEQAISQFVPSLAAEQENFYSDPALSPHDMSSPHTAPTLDEYTSGSEIDLFISQDSSEQVRDEFANMTSNGLSDFSAGYSFVDSSGFPSSSMYSTFPEKTFSSLPPLEQSYVDQIDTLSQEFLNDPWAWPLPTTFSLSANKTWNRQRVSLYLYGVTLLRRFEWVCTIDDTTKNTSFSFDMSNLPSGIWRFLCTFCFYGALATWATKEFMPLLFCPILLLLPFTSVSLLYFEASGWYIQGSFEPCEAIFCCFVSGRFIGFYPLIAPFFTIRYVLHGSSMELYVAS